MSSSANRDRFRAEENRSTPPSQQVSASAVTGPARPGRAPLRVISPSGMFLFW
jgi:hypothetical protein